jgi:N-hydroxyarylamine O-acetyltransferase
MESSPQTEVDVDAYFTRIGWSGDPRPTRATLEALHLAHTTHIPFENLDILLGRGIHIDLESIQAKLVWGKRGGYCFEQNTLLAAVLERMGFQVTRLAARVRMGTTRVLPRSHMLLKVDLEDGAFIADVGFGSAGLLHPFPLKSGPICRQFAWSYRLLESDGLWRLQLMKGTEWMDLYAFTMEPQFPVDFEVANYYVSTHPLSRFTQTLVVQLATPAARYGLVNREFTTDRGAEALTRTIVNDDELLEALSESFGLEFPSGTRFSPLRPS